MSVLKIIKEIDENQMNVDDSDCDSKSIEVHDDIIDRDDFRRGNPSFHSRFKKYHSKLYSSNEIESSDFGNSVGIIGGDTTFFLGLEAYLNNDFEKERNLSAIKLYKEAFLEIADGVLIEMDMVRKKKIDISDYIQMISLKTSTLIEKALLIGCNYAETEQKNKILFSNYGMNLGRVFQITDDILGTFGDEEKTGKPTDGDIREGKKTCLLITTLNTLKGEKEKRLNDLVGKKDITENEVDQVKDLFKEANADAICRNLAQKYYEDAFKSLEDLKNIINSSEYAFFESLLNFIIKRNY